MKFYEPPRLKVLWVDDRPDNNLPMVQDLMRRGVHVSLATNTKLALQLLADHRYIAVVSDMGRREGAREGFHLLDVMRSRGDDTPFFVFASLSAPALTDEVLLHDGQGSTNDWGQLLAELDKLIPREAAN